MPGTISNQQALIYVMVMMSAVEGQITTDELQEIELLLRTTPAFKSFDRARLVTVVQECSDILQNEEGMTTVLGLVNNQLPARLKETAYALAVPSIEQCPDSCRHRAGFARRRLLAGAGVCRCSKVSPIISRCCAPSVRRAGVPLDSMARALRFAVEPARDLERA